MKEKTGQKERRRKNHVLLFEFLPGLDDERRRLPQFGVDKSNPETIPRAFHILLQVSSVHQYVRQIGEVLDRLGKSATGSEPWRRGQTAFCRDRSDRCFKGVKPSTRAWLNKRSVGFRADGKGCKSGGNSCCAA
jgi:hypothetical protein